MIDQYPNTSQSFELCDDGWHRRVPRLDQRPRAAFISHVSDLLGQLPGRKGREYHLEIGTDVVAVRATTVIII